MGELNLSIRGTNADLAEKYRWFCNVGYREPILNDPKIILDKASPEYVDLLITKAMKEIDNSPPPQNPPTKLVA